MSESIKIKDAPLVSEAGDDVKMPCSDGSGLPKAVSVSQIAEHISDGEIVNIVLNTSYVSDAAIIGASVKVVNASNGASIYSGTWQGDDISVKIHGAGVSYYIEVGEVDGYLTPRRKQYTSAICNSHTAIFTYQYATGDVIVIDQNITDPATMISGDVNGPTIQWIRKNSHRYLGKYLGNGKMSVCQLSDANSNLYFDGTASDLTGSEGDVFMKLPEFYTKTVEIAPDVWQIEFNRYQVNPTYKKWGGNVLIGVYEAFVTGTSAYSRSGVASSGSINFTNFKQYAANRGSGYSLIKWSEHCIMAFLFYAQYGNTNSQGKIGSGTNSYEKETGQTDVLGMSDTVKGGNGSSGSINFWGLENWWGNKYEFMEGLTSVTNEDGIVVMRVEGEDGINRDYVPLNEVSSYPTKMAIGDNLDLIMTAINGSSSTGYCDVTRFSKVAGRFARRSCDSNYVEGGVATVNVSVDALAKAAWDGSRLAFKGEITEAKSVSAFKELSIIN